MWQYSTVRWKKESLYLSIAVDINFLAYFLLRMRGQNSRKMVFGDSETPPFTPNHFRRIFGVKYWWHGFNISDKSFEYKKALPSAGGQP